MWFELQERVWFEEEEESWSAGRADPAAGCSFPHPKPRRRPRVCGSPVSGVAPTTALLSSLLLCQRPTPLTGSHSRVVLKLVVSCASEAVRLCCAVRLRRSPTSGRRLPLTFFVGDTGSQQQTLLFVVMVSNQNIIGYSVVKK